MSFCIFLPSFAPLHYFSFIFFLPLLLDRATAKLSQLGTFEQSVAAQLNLVCRCVPFEHSAQRDIDTFQHLAMVAPVHLHNCHRFQTQRYRWRFACHTYEKTVNFPFSCDIHDLFSFVRQVKLNFSQSVFSFRARQPSSIRSSFMTRLDSMTSGRFRHRFRPLEVFDVGLDRRSPPFSCPVIEVSKLRFQRFGFSFRFSLQNRQSRSSPNLATFKFS